MGPDSGEVKSGKANGGLIRKGPTCRRLIATLFLNRRLALYVCISAGVPEAIHLSIRARQYTHAPADCICCRSGLRDIPALPVTDTHGIDCMRAVHTHGLG